MKFLSCALALGLTAAQHTPQGAYDGSIKKMGETVNFNGFVHGNSSTLDLTIAASGLKKVDINCPGVKFVLADDGSVTLPTSTTKGDCIHDALKSNDVQLKGVQYDSKDDTITVSVHAILDLNIVAHHSKAVDMLKLQAVAGERHSHHRAVKEAERRVDALRHDLEALDEIEHAYHHHPLAEHVIAFKAEHDLKELQRDTKTALRGAGTQFGDSTCSNRGVCGKAYQGCCLAAHVWGPPCACSLIDGSGAIDDPSCRDKCGIAFGACCLAEGTCTCDISPSS